MERWMRSPSRCALAITLIVIALATVTAIQLGEMLDAVERSRDGWVLFGRQLAQWSVWGLLAAPIVWFGRRSVARWPSVWVVIVTQVALGLGISAGVTLAHERIDAAMFEGGSPMARPHRAPGEERPDRPDRPERRRGPRRPRPGEGDLWTSPRLARNLLVYTTILGAGLALAATVRARAQERRTARLEVELGAARMAALQRQLRPHFLFNALHAVGGLVRQRRDGEVQQILSGLAALLRTSLRADDDTTSALASELELVRHYLDIEAIRLGERLTTDIAEARGELGATPVPSLVLLPLIENAVQHGVAPREEGGRVALSLGEQDGFVEIVLRDDGPGFPDDVLAGNVSARAAGPGSGASIGLANTRARLELFADTASFELRNDDGAVVTIRVPAVGST